MPRTREVSIFEKKTKRTMKIFVQYAKGLIFGAFLLVLPLAFSDQAIAATCEASCGSGKTCACQETCASPGVIKSGTFDNCKSSDGYVCCETASSSSGSCDSNYCKATCDPNTEESKPACKSSCPASKPEYCQPKSSSGGGSGGGSASVTISLPNPLKYNTVQQVVTALLYALQGLIVALSLVFIVIGAVLYITSAGNQNRVTMAKTAITAALIGLSIGILAPTFLKEVATVLGWNSSLPASVSGARGAGDILLSVLNFLLGIVGVLAIIMMVVGGAMFLGAAGDMNRIGTAKKIITYAIIGLIVALASLVVVRQLAEFFAPATS